MARAVSGSMCSFVIELNCKGLLLVGLRGWDFRCSARRSGCSRFPLSERVVYWCAAQ